MSFLKKAVPTALAVSICVFGVSSCKEQVESKQATSSESPSAASVEINSMEDKLSYLMGYSIAKQVGEAELKIQPDVLLMAIEDAQNGVESKIGDVESRKLGSEFQSLIQEKRQSTERNKNIELGKAYLDKNGQRPEVTQTGSGIQYEVLASGDESAAMPTEKDSVRVHYSGTLLDGTVFDSSIEGGEPVKFGVTQVIAGWTEVLQLMREGDKWKVSIPYNLAYPNGTRNIRPGSTLIFEIELLEVIPAKS